MAKKKNIEPEYPYVKANVEDLIRLFKNLTNIIALVTKVYLDEEYIEKNEEINNKLNKIKTILELVDTL